MPASGTNAQVVLTLIEWRNVIYTNTINSTLTINLGFGQEGVVGEQQQQQLNSLHHLFGAYLSVSPVLMTQPVGVVSCLLTALISSAINIFYIV